jgi:hypothetical protein
MSEGFEYKPRARWHQDPKHWTRANIDRVLKKNPALRAALDLMGIPAEDVAIKAEMREIRRGQLEGQNALLSAVAKPDKRVGAATRRSEDSKKIDPRATAEAQKDKIEEYLNGGMVVEKDPEPGMGACTKLHMGVGPYDNVCKPDSLCEYREEDLQLGLVSMSRIKLTDPEGSGSL